MTGCGHGRTLRPMSNETVPTQRHAALIRDWVAMFSLRDRGAAERLAAETAAEAYVEHAVAPFGRVAPGPVHGPTHLVEAAAWLLAQFPDLAMSVEALVVDGDLAAALVRSRGTNLGAVNGTIPPTGRTFEALQSHWFRVRDGRIAEHWATRDDLGVMLDLGLIATPGGESRGRDGRDAGGPPTATGS